ncbi:MAG: hypothetical protein AAFQ43_12275, partial [Bacteroidota bacterium]
METLALDRSRPFRSHLAVVKRHAAAHARRAAINSSTIALGEGLALALALLAAGFLRQIWAGEAQMSVGAGWAVIPLYLAGAALWRLLPGWGLGAVEEFRRQTLTLVCAFVGTALATWLAGSGSPVDASRLTLGLAGVFALVLVPLARGKAKAILIDRDAWGVPAVIYGAGEAGSRIVRRLQEERGMGYQPVAVFDEDADRWGDYLDTVPIVGDVEQIAPEAAVAFLALPEARRERQAQLLEGPLALYPTVVVVPELLDAPSLSVRPRDISGILGLEIAASL